MKVTFCKLLLLPWALCLLASALHASKSPRELLEQSSKLFDKGHYAEALKTIAQLDIRSALDNSEEMKLAFKIKATAYAQLNKEAEARETIRELLFLDPTYKFNPFDTPKNVLTLAEQEDLVITQKNESLSLARPPIEPAVASPEGLFERKIVIKELPPLSASLFPFGLNHFYLSSPLKGSAYMALQILGLTTNVGAYWWKQKFLPKYGIPRLDYNHNKHRFETAQAIQYIAISTAVLAFCVSVVDALIKINAFSSDDKSPEFAINTQNL